jgi:OOP family OmpA-OmpF porin
VDADGCALDADADGVVNAKDRCPGTPAGTAVNASGCERDSDNDGIVDSLDACAGTQKGDVVDDRGCVIIAERVTLKGVTFPNNSATLAATSRIVLDNMAGTLRKHPTLRVEVAGHIDNTGAAAYSVHLSAQRAQAVRQYLIGQGVDAKRMVAKGYGPANPITSNASAAERAENRRVELRVIGR